jgi:hypothetical protein
VDFAISVFLLKNRRGYSLPAFNFGYLEKETGTEWRLTCGGTRAYMVRHATPLNRVFGKTRRVQLNEVTLKSIQNEFHRGMVFRAEISFDHRGNYAGIEVHHWPMHQHLAKASSQVLGSLSLAQRRVRIPASQIQTQCGLGEISGLDPTRSRCQILLRNLHIDQKRVGVSDCSCKASHLASVECHLSIDLIVNEAEGPSKRRPNRHAGRIAQLVAEADERGKAEIVDAAREWVRSHDRRA